MLRHIEAGRLSLADAGEITGFVNSSKGWSDMVYMHGIGCFAHLLKSDLCMLPSEDIVTGLWSKQYGGAYSYYEWLCISRSIGCEYLCHKVVGTFIFLLCQQESRYCFPSDQRRHVLLSFQTLYVSESFDFSLNTHASIRSTVWECIEFEDQLPPSWEALWQHWLRCCWVAHFWGQAGQKTYMYHLLLLSEFGWKLVRAPFKLIGTLLRF